MNTPHEVAANNIARHLVLVCAIALVFALSACGKPATKPSGTAPAQPTTSNPASPGPPSAPVQTPPPAAPKSGPVTAPTGEEDLIDIGSVTIETAADANKGVPFEVDLVFVYDATVLGSIANDSAADWFKGKAALTVNAGNALSVISWRITPGEEVAETPVDVPSGALAAFLFANYAAPGAHRQSVEGAGTLAVTLGADDASIDVEQ